MEKQLNICEECNKELTQDEKELNNFMIDEFTFNYCSNCWTYEKIKEENPLNKIIDNKKISEKPVIKITEKPIYEEPIDFEIIKIEPIIKEKCNWEGHCKIFKNVDVNKKVFILFKNKVYNFCNECFYGIVCAKN